MCDPIFLGEPSVTDVPERPLPSDYRPDFHRLADLLLTLTAARSVAGAIETFATRLVAERPHVARLCVWLADGATLRLVGSARRPGIEAAEWTHAGGDFRAVSPDEPLVGRVWRDQEPAFARTEADWPDYPGWAGRDGVVAYYAAPVGHRGEAFGAVGSFLRYRFDDPAEHAQALAWTRVFADHLGGAVANARAFERIEELSRRLERENDYLRQEVCDARGFGAIVGNSPALKRALRQVELVAPTDAGVLILGETGTGKELIARAVHDRSRRAAGPLITVNCAAVPRELFESEFFGHVKGSFTGAVRDRVGRFELADGGTLFLDEVGEIPLELQGKLLRVLQEGTFARVGEDRTRSADVRVVAATNCNLGSEATAGRFRQDLYYRLGVFPVELPPLRDRPDDIPLLAAHLLQAATRGTGRPAPRLTAEHARQLRAYPWPGNVRELQNVVERAVILAGSGPLQFDLDAGPKPVARPPAGANPPDAVRTYAELAELERANMTLALERAGGKVAGPGGAAERLGLKPSTLDAKMKALGVRRRPG
ncbi:MAG: sigma 54-interacting transcriptional regulator [Gemmataceae bacterium]|nr:sigma 54-interacting transcriptional regulator [Gemmataceae bacterium]